MEPQEPRPYTSPRAIALSFAGAVALCALYVTQGKDADFRPYQGSTTAHVTLVATQDQRLSPVTHSRLVSHDTLATLAFSGCTAPFQPDAVSNATAVDYTQQALIRNRNTLPNISFQSAQDANSIIYCRSVVVALPDSLTVSVDLPLLYTLQTFAEAAAAQTHYPEQPRSLQVSFSKVPASLHTYRMNLFPVKTIWQVNELEFNILPTSQVPVAQ